MLCVWLPLNGDLHNQGLITLPNTSVNTFTYENGKIGQCANGRVAWHLDEEILGNTWSVAMWVKPGTLGSNNNVLFCKNNTGSTDCHIYFSIISTTQLNIGVNGPSSSVTATGQSFSTGVWYHVAATYDGATATLYLNGAELKHGTVNTACPTGRLNMNINGRSTNAANTTTTGQITCSFNDFRLYDHCLSAAEVKEISQGLVLHYTLSDIPCINLIKNGFGELGLENWSNSTRVSTDVPSVDTSIKQSFYNQRTLELIPIISSHQYQFSCYVKSTGSSGSTYPSFQPYDIDGKALNNYHEPDGFQTATRTTLAQPLNPGDTQIYATSLASWPTHTNKRRVAIFSYRDNHGNLYPDWEYTQNTIEYGTSDNLNKTTNIITLPTAYSGPSMPAGTSICQSIYGGTYWYPCGAISKTSVSEWTQKSLTFIPKNINRLKYAHYVVYIADWTNDVLHAGIKLIDTTYSNIVQDSSGYNNNGTITGNISLSSNSSHYSDCIYIPSGNTDYITTNDEIGNFSSGITMNIWFKSSCTTPGSSYHEIFNIATATQNFEMAIYKTGYFRGGMIINGTRYVDNTNNTNLVDGNWHMITMTYDGTTLRRYVDAIDKKDTTISGTLTATSCKFLLGHYGTNTSYYAKEAYLSDCRIYTTALSADNIRQLYEVSAKVDNKQNLHAFELVEANSKIQITKQGRVKCNELEEDEKTKFYQTNQIIDTNEFIEL